jgi:hypothetical protein
LLATADGADEVALWESSPTRIDWPPEEDGTQVLTRLYRPEDVLFVGGKYDTQVHSVREWLQILEKSPRVGAGELPRSPAVGVRCGASAGG